MDFTGKKIYYVALGKPDGRDYRMMDDNGIHVIAESYNEAELKAELHFTNELNDKPSVISADGSLIKPEEKIKMIKRIEIVTDKII